MFKATLIVSILLTTLLLVPQVRAQDAVDRAVAPVYPDVALSLAIQGSVSIDAVTNKDGTVVSSSCQSGDKILCAVAQQAVSKWRFGAHNPAGPVRLTFVFLIVADDTDNREMGVVFLPSTRTMEIRGKHRPAIDSPNIRKKGDTELKRPT